MKSLHSKDQPHPTPTKADPVKSPEPINEAAQPYAVPTKTGLVNLPRWLKELIVQIAVGTGFKLLFGTAIAKWIFGIIAVWILSEIFGYSPIEIFFFRIIGFFS